MRVSTVIPAFNAARFVAEAIESALAQSAPPAEVIVVDDGSTDATVEVVGRFGTPVRCVSQTRGGIGAARNRGVAAARGEAFAFLDADDRWTPEALAARLAALRARPEVDLVLGRVIEVPQAHWNARVSRGAAPGDASVPGYLASAALVHRTAWERVGPFDPTLRAGEFIDWFLRARARGLGIHHLPAVVLWRRIHDANHGIRAREGYVDYARILKQELDRRRGAGAPPSAP